MRSMPGCSLGLVTMRNVSDWGRDFAQTYLVIPTQEARFAAICEFSSTNTYTQRFVIQTIGITDRFGWPTNYHTIKVPKFSIALANGSCYGLKHAKLGDAPGARSTTACIRTRNSASLVERFVHFRVRKHHI